MRGYGFASGTLSFIGMDYPACSQMMLVASGGLAVEKILHYECLRMLTELIC
jgi:hypothetical protein